MTSSYELLTTHHPNPIVAWSHRSRIARGVNLVESHLPEGGDVLDVGAGDGAFLRCLHAKRPNFTGSGVDPFCKVQYPFSHFDQITDVEGTYDVITAFETLEHLNREYLDNFYSLVRKKLRVGGVAIISVPILIGPVLIPKNINARRTGASWVYSNQEMLLGALLGKLPKSRGHSGGQLNHRGFDFRIVKREINEIFEIKQAFSAPFKQIWWGLNSQWFCVFGNK